MHKLLVEKKEKELKEKRFAGKKELDKDGDGVPKWADKDDSDPKAGSKKSPKKKGGKIPAQLKMHIKGKKKKSKLDEQIEKLEKILFEELTDSVVQTDINPLEEYGEDKYSSMEDEDFDDEDFDDEEFEDVEGDEDFEDDEEDFDYDFEEDEEESEEEYLTEAEVKKKKPRLGKVTRNPSGSNKKFHVYVKCGGRVKKISFGDPGLSIKRDSAARRKNFRARHKCDKPAGKDRCTARYWSCYQWRAGKKVEGE